MGPSIYLSILIRMIDSMTSHSSPTRPLLPRSPTSPHSVRSSVSTLAPHQAEDVHEIPVLPVEVAHLIGVLKSFGAEFRPSGAGRSPMVFSPPVRGNESLKASSDPLGRWLYHIKRMAKRDERMNSDERMSPCPWSFSPANEIQFTCSIASVTSFAV